MNWRLGICLTVAAVVAGCVPPQQRAGNPTRGELVAIEWCGGCHEVGIDPVAARSAARAPSFQAIAVREDAEFARTRKFMGELHPPMPTFRLWDDEREDIIAYLQFLRFARVAK